MRVCVGSPGSSRHGSAARRRSRSGVGDRDHLGALGEAGQRFRDAVSRPTSDTRVDLVEHERLATGYGGEGNARQLAARADLGERGERQARVRPDQEHDLVGAGGASSRSRTSAANSPSPIPTPRSSSATAAAKESAASRRATPSSASQRRVPLLGCRELLRRGGDGVASSRHGLELLLRLGPPREQPSYVAHRKRRFAAAIRSSRSSTCSTRPGSVSRPARKRWSSLPTSRSRGPGRGARHPRPAARAPAARGVERALGRRREPRRTVSFLGCDRLRRRTGGIPHGRRPGAGAPARRGGRPRRPAPCLRCPRRVPRAHAAVQQRHQRRGQARRAGAWRLRRHAMLPAGSSALELRRHRTRRARRADTTTARGGAARTGRTWRSAAPQPRRDLPVRPPSPMRTRASGRRRTPAARQRVRARPRGAPRRVPRAPRPPRSRRARRARPRHRPRGLPGPIAAASPRAPRRSPIACAKIVFPAPVSPVTALRPPARSSSASRMRTRFSIRRLRSKALAVTLHEARLGQGGEQRPVGPEAHHHPPAGARIGHTVPSTSTAASTSDVRFQTMRSRPRGTTRVGRAASVGRRTSRPSRRCPTSARGRRSRGCRPSSRTASSRSDRRTADRRGPRRRPPTPARSCGPARRSTRRRRSTPPSRSPASTSRVASSTTRTRRRRSVPPRPPARLAGSS